MSCRPTDCHLGPARLNWGCQNVVLRRSFSLPRFDLLSEIRFSSTLLVSSQHLCFYSNKIVLWFILFSVLCLGGAFCSPVSPENPVWSFWVERRKHMTALKGCSLQGEAAKERLPLQAAQLLHTAWAQLKIDPLYSGERMQWERKSRLGRSHNKSGSAWALQPSGCDWDCSHLSSSLVYLFQHMSTWSRPPVSPRCQGVEIVGSGILDWRSTLPERSWKDFQSHVPSFARFQVEQSTWSMWSGGIFGLKNEMRLKMRFRKFSACAAENLCPP